MRVFLTGGSGYIGTSVLQALRLSGHEVSALARSPDAAAKLRSLGALPILGDLSSLDVLRQAASEADAVLHLGFVYNFAEIQHSLELDLLAVRAMLGSMIGSGKTFVGTNGTLGIRTQSGQVATEDTPLADATMVRGPAEMMIRNASGMRGLVVSLAPTVHGKGDRSFIPELIVVAKRNAVSLFPGEGKNAWQAIHRDDAAQLFRVALESGKPGRRYHGVAESAIPMHDIAMNIGEGLGIRTESVRLEDAAARMGWIGPIAALGGPVSSQITQEELGWRPVGPTLFRDLRLSYF